MKKNKVCLSDRQGFAPIAIVLIVVAVLAVGGVAYYAGKSFKKENNFTSQPAGNDIAQPAVKENANIVDSNNSDITIYTSDRLGIQFTYPKIISITSGSKNNLITTSNLVSVTENDNKLIVSAGDFGSSYALIFYKNPNETFEQSILRQLIKPEYQNNPCYVEKLSTGNNYIITFKGDIWPADGPWNNEARKDFKKCSPYGGGYFYADPVSGGFYMADTGSHSPVFGVDTSQWWPKGIKFIK